MEIADIPNNCYCTTCMLCDGLVKIYNPNHPYIVCKDCKDLIKQLKEEKHAKQLKEGD